MPDLRSITDADERVAAWRAQISFTDVQIAEAIREEAAIYDDTHDGRFLRQRFEKLAAHLLKTGRLSKHMLRIALPRLVKYCALCGKTALYRYGTDGRCSKHRLERPAWMAGWNQIRENREDTYMSGVQDKERGKKLQDKRAAPRRGRPKDRRQ